MSGAAVHRSGFIAVVGRPNVGKSTLLNALLGQKIAGVSPRPQTTRRRQMGILTLPAAQIIFHDTPGWHVPKDRLGEAMVRSSEAAVSDSDVVLLLADLTEAPADADREFAAWLEKNRRTAPVVMALTKSDAVSAAVREKRAAEYGRLLPDAGCCVISAERDQGLQDLLEMLISRLPEGPDLYPEEAITDFSEREITADLIREAALHRLRAEVPHGVAVRIDQYRERGTEGAYVEATLFVEKPSHKAIVIGKGGTMLKAIGSDARRSIEKMSGRRLFLQLRVKVLPGWRNREDALRRLGYLPRKK
ncbi:MAG: GTPase Era [Anaerolineales bacterium]